MKMVPGAARDVNTVLSIPCMVEDCGGEPSDGSRSGLLVFSSLEHFSCYVLSVYTPKAEQTGKLSASGLYQLFDANVRTADILLNLGRRNVSIGAVPMLAWNSPKFARLLHQVFQPKNQWSFGSGDSISKGSENTEYEALSWFIIYKVSAEEILKGRHFEIENYISGISSGSDLRQGIAISTRSYPFGPEFMEIFTDTRSHGIISNISASDQATLFLTDARCLPGSEGGGVYVCSANQSRLVGMIMTPLCWKTQELVGFAVCCSVQQIFQSLQNVVGHLPLSDARHGIEDLCRKVLYTDTHDRLSNRSQSEVSIVVRVDCGGIWGSGVVVAARQKNDLYEAIIVTCQHVIERNDGSVSVTFGESEDRHAAKVIYATDDNSAFDLAILSLDVELPMAEVFRNQYHSNDGDHIFTIRHCQKTCDFTKGSAVFMKGYPLFDVESKLGPSVSQGVLSNVVHHRGSPVLLHTTCLVHKGSSGGGLFCAQDGCLKGIVVNHVKDDENKISYPDVNFAIPSNVFMPTVKRYLGCNDPSAFHSLNCFDKEVKRIWHLEPQKIQSKL